MTHSFSDIDDLRKKVPAELLSQYQLGPVMGRGGHGIAVKAVQLGLRRNVVLKFLTLHDPLVSRRFLREAEILMKIRHPNVVRLYDSGHTNPYAYLALEYLEGEPLSRRIASCSLDLPQILGIAHDVLSGLEAIHAAQVVHRDIKPANLMVLPDGQTKILDLGVARAQDAAALTATGAFLGTPLYSSPEQLQGETADLRTDLYSLGVVLHECLTGVNPFIADNLTDIVQKHLTLPIHAIRGSRYEDHPGLERLIVELLKKQPELRPASAAEARCLLQERGPPGIPVGATTEADAPAPAPVPARRRTRGPPPRATSPTPLPQKAPYGRRVQVLTVLVGIVAAVPWLRSRDGGTPVSRPTAAASSGAPRLSWDPVTEHRLVAGGFEKVLARRDLRLVKVGSPDQWNLLPAEADSADARRIVDLCLDFLEVTSHLKKIESSVDHAGIPASASCVLASLICLRYVQWAELISEKQLARSVKDPDYPRADLADFFRVVPARQDSTALFHFRKATQAVLGALDACASEGRAPETFADVLRMGYEILWFGESFVWSPETLGGWRQARQHFEDELTRRSAGPAPGSMLSKLTLMCANAGRKSQTSADPGLPEKEFADKVQECVRRGFLPESMSRQKLGGYTVGDGVQAGKQAPAR